MEITAWWRGVLDAFRHPALWLTLALVANFLEGALRKWVPGFSDVGSGFILAYFSKDLLFGLGVVLVATRRWQPTRGMKSAKQWGCPALGLIVFGGVLSWVSAEVNPVGALLTLRPLLVLPLLAWCYAATQRGSVPLLGIAALVRLLAITNGALSLLQNSLPPDDALNKYARDEKDVVEVSYGVRATGTFAYISGLKVASATGVWAGMVWISLGRNRWHLWFGALCLLGGFACAFASISRSTLVVAFAMLGLWVLTSVRAFRLLVQGTLVIALVAVVLLMLAPGMAERFSHAGEGSFDRFESAGDSNAERAFGQWLESWYAVQTTPLGNGLGTEQIGGNIISKGVANFTNYENQFPRIVSELGVLGFIGFFMLVIATIWGLQVAKEGPGGTPWRLAVTATQLFLMGQFYESLVFNHTASASVWLLAAAVFGAEPHPAPISTPQGKDGFCRS
jgi:hypothetical protein